MGARAARAENKFAHFTIAKGNGKHKYPASSFEFVKYPYRHLVLQVEEQLAENRCIASENRQLRRTLVAYEKKLSSYQTFDHGDLYLGE
ncbi:conjugative transfer protein MobI(A/C) [Pseudomonas cedrina]|uniref:conjugative transfer protein MobI(A/C) n=1 Tax=Pseudomonas cedrina TaxID=651740 RepID=UPI003EDA48A7